MPTYTYACEKCGHNLDVVQSFSDNPMRDCPNCGQASLHRVYRPVGIVFKGSGFYETDYKNKSGKKPDDSAKKTDGSISESTTAKNDNGTQKNNSDKKDVKTSNPAKAAS